MRIYLEKEEEEISKEFSGKVKELLKLLKINPHTVLVSRGTELITEEDYLKDSDKIKILEVISGG